MSIKTPGLNLFGGIALISDTFLSEYTRFVLSRQVAFCTIIALAQAVCLVVGGMTLWLERSSGRRRGDRL